MARAPARGFQPVRKIRIGTVYPATIGVLPAFLARICRKYPDIELHVSSGSTNDIIRGLENGQINLGFIRPVENIGSLRFFSIAHERYLLAVEKNRTLLARSEIGIEDLKGQKIISFSRQNLSYMERYFAEKFEAHDLSKSIAYTCDDTFSLVSLVSASALRRNGRWICPTAISSSGRCKGRRLQDRARGCLVQGRSDGSPRRHHRYRPVVGQGGQVRGNVSRGRFWCDPRSSGAASRHQRAIYSTGHRCSEVAWSLVQRVENVERLVSILTIAANHFPRAYLGRLTAERSCGGFLRVTGRNRQLYARPHAFSP
jgi:hypothetical protein